MPTSETTYLVKVSPPSSLRTELNIVAAVVAVGICLVILALLAHTPPRRPRFTTRAHRRTQSRRPARRRATLPPEAERNRRPSAGGLPAYELR